MEDQNLASKKQSDSITIIIIVSLVIIFIILIIIIIIPIALSQSSPSRSLQSGGCNQCQQNPENNNLLTPIYSQSTALTLGDIANAAYYAFFNTELMNQWIMYSGLYLTQVTQFYVNSTQILGFTSFLGNDESRVMVAFTGTQPVDLPQTIIDDLLIGKVDFPYTGGMVAEGFYKSWESVKYYVQSIMNISTKELWVVGHSLGGAICTLAAVEMKKTYPNCKVVSYTYASPKVGDQAFVNGYNDLGIFTNRIQNYWDIIPRLPFTAVLGYEHVNTLILLRRFSKLNITKCVYDSAPPDNYLYDPFDWATQHSLITYLNLIGTCSDVLISEIE